MVADELVRLVPDPIPVRVTRFKGSLMLEPVFTITDRWSALVHTGVTQTFRNIGFEPLEERAHSATLSSYASFFWGVGGEFRAGPLFVGLGFDVLLPMDDTVPAMPVLSLTMGPRFPGREERAAASEASD